MPHRHYETEGLILGYRNLGEANRLYQVFTKDFGLINVLASGVRLNQSKLRYHLQSFSFVLLVVVRGREFWRLVGVSGAEQIDPPRQAEVLFLKKMSLLINRLVHGEETNPLIYLTFKQASYLINTVNSLTAEMVSCLEIFVSSSLLIQLGYLSLPPAWQKIFSTTEFSWAELKQVEKNKIFLIQKINKSLLSTHL